MRTRRESMEQSADDLSVVDDVGIHVTRREDPMKTRRESLSEQSGNGAGDEDGSTIQLPAGLRERFTVVEELPDPGAEADVVRVLDGGGEQFVVKLYRRNVDASREVWGKLRDISSPYVVRILETGTSARRDHEVMEYLPGGNLLSLRDAFGGVLPANVATEVVRQVVHGLDALHTAGIVHRDLKPENVLVRSGNPTRGPAAPLHVVLTDFGLARAPEQSVVQASRTGTMTYMAPELWLVEGSQSSKARDWWALGLIICELLTGKHPFEGMTTQAIAGAVQRPIDVRGVTDPRLQLLCRGLLTRLREDRWGATQVMAWLAGASPEVRDEASVHVNPNGPGLKPVKYAGEQYRDPAQLASAFARSWEDATRRYVAGLSKNSVPPQAWMSLYTWLQQFDDPDDTRAESLEDLVDGALLSDLPPDVKMLRLLQWLDPQLTPVYRGLLISAETLPVLAARASDSTSTDHAAAARVLDDLWAYQLLPVLATMPGGRPLAGIAERWTSLARDLTLRADTTFQQVPPDARPTDDEGLTRAILLRLAVDRSGISANLQAMRGKAVAAVPGPVAWFQHVVTTSTHGPLDDVVVLRLAPAAARQAQAEIQAARAAAAERQRREAAWEEKERSRTGGIPAARSRAVGYLVTIGVVMAVDLVIAASIKGSSTKGSSTTVNADGTTSSGSIAGLVVLSLLVASGALAFAALTELPLAEKIGAQYPYYSPMARAGTTLRSLGSRIDSPGRGLVALVVGLPLAFAVISLPPLFYAVLAAGHGLSWRSRRERWNQAYELERTRTLGTS
jgi:serine/threonine protein kinase